MSRFTTGSSAAAADPIRRYHRRMSFSAQSFLEQRRFSHPSAVASARRRPGLHPRLRKDSSCHPVPPVTSVVARSARTFSPTIVRSPRSSERSIGGGAAPCGATRVRTVRGNLGALVQPSRRAEDRPARVPAHTVGRRRGAAGGAAQDAAALAGGVPRLDRTTTPSALPPATYAALFAAQERWACSRRCAGRVSSERRPGRRS